MAAFVDGPVAHLHVAHSPYDLADVIYSPYGEMGGAYNSPDVWVTKSRSQGGFDSCSAAVVIFDRWGRG